MFARRFQWMLALAALTAASGGALADDTRKPADPVLDDELLEFLGSVDPTSDAVQPDDGTWIEYLSQTDIGRSAKPGDPTVVAAKPVMPPKPGPSGTKQNE